MNIKRWVFFLVLFLCCRTLYAQPFNSAIINYSAAGKRVLYYDGVKVSLKSYDENGSITQKFFYDGNDYYYVYYKKPKVAYKISKEQFLQKLYLAPEPVDEEFYTDVFLGKQCKVYTKETKTEFSNTDMTSVSKLYYWEGLFLKRMETTSVNGKSFDNVVEATDIQINIPVSRKIFQVPTNIKVVSRKEADMMLVNKLRNQFKGSGMGKGKKESKISNFRMSVRFPLETKKEEEKESSMPMQKSPLMMIVGAILAVCTLLVIYIFK